MTDPQNDLFFDDEPELLNDEDEVRVKSKNDELPLLEDAPPKPKNGAPAHIPVRNAQSPPRKRRTLTYCCLATFVSVAVMCCVLPVLGFGGLVALGALSESNEVTSTSTETLDLNNDGVVFLDVSNTVGSTEIRGADVDEITVEIQRRATGFSKESAREALNDLTVDVRREGNRYIVEVEDSSSGWLIFNEPTVSLDITVPRELNITASNDVGGLSIRDVEIVDALTLQNDVGGIEFWGKIGPEGTHSIQNDVGGIEIHIAEGSSFHLNASTDVGGIELNLLLNNSSTTRETVSQTETGIYGDDDDPQARLTVIANVGGIEIWD